MIISILELALAIIIVISIIIATPFIIASIVASFWFITEIPFILIDKLKYINRKG